MKFNGSITKLVIFLCLFLSFITIRSNANESTLQTKTLNNLFTAIETNNYNQFVIEADNSFKDKFTKQMLSSLNELFSPKIKKGYDKVYLGELRQQGCNVYLWKLIFKDNSDNILARLVIKDNKVAGFFLQ